MFWMHMSKIDVHIELPAASWFSTTVLLHPTLNSLTA
jgi:hypothetical protein